MSGNPPTIDFGQVPTIRYKEMTFTMTNITTSNNLGNNLALKSLPLGALLPTSDEFSCMSGCSPSLAAGAVRTVTLRFTPKSEAVLGPVGLYPSGYPLYFFEVKGQGVKPIFNVKEE